MTETTLEPIRDLAALIAFILIVIITGVWFCAGKLEAIRKLLEKMK